MAAERRLRLAIGALAVVGIAISGYLTSVRLVGASPACVIGGSCAAVQSSRYAELAGVPVAVLGLFGYGALLVSALLAGSVAKLLGLLAGLVGVGFSLWLTYVELGVIDAVCPWCVTSAVVVTIAAGLALCRVMLTEPQTVGAPGRSR